MIKTKAEKAILVVASYGFVNCCWSLSRCGCRGGLVRVANLLNLITLVTATSATRSTLLAYLIICFSRVAILATRTGKVDFPILTR